MDMMAISPYLECDCGKGLFIKCIRLKQMQTGGIVEETAGWYCLACSGKAEGAKLLRARQLKEKKEELEKLQQEVEGEKKGPTAAATTGSGKAGLPHQDT